MNATSDASRGQRGGGARRQSGPGASVVLLVDDVPDNLLALEGMLRRPDIDIVTAGSGQEALEVLLHRDVAVAIVDVMMPEMDGFELADLIRGVEMTRRVPIIFVTAGTATYRAFTGYQTGAIDFLYKPLDANVLRAKVDVLVALERERRAAERARLETETLLRLAQATGRCERVDDVYAPALDAARELLGATRAAILLVDDAGKMRLRAWHGLSDSYRTAIDGRSPWMSGEKDPKPLLAGDVAADERVASDRETLRREGVGAVAFVPLFSKKLVGNFVLHWDAPRAFSPHDEAIAVSVALHVAEALERLSLREIERRGLVRITRLQRVTTALNQSLTPQAVAHACISAVSDELAISAVTLQLLSADGAELELLASAGLSEETRDAIQRVRLDDRLASTTVIATGQPLFFESYDDYLAAFPHLRPSAPIGGRPACIPVQVGDRVIGSFNVVLSPSSPSPIPDEDRAFLLAAVAQCALALDRARLHGKEREAREAAAADASRKAFLAEASAELAKSLDYETTLESIARLAVPRMADWCSVNMRKEGEPEPALVAVVVHEDPAKLELALGFGARDAAKKTLRMTSGIAVPIVGKGRILGVLGFVTAESGRRYDEKDLEMAEELGRRAGVAIENARLYEAEGRARRDAEIAEEAARASEQRERERAAELQTVLDLAPNPFFIVHDTAGAHITGNRAADQLLRLPRGAEVSLSASPDTRPRHFKAMKDGRELSADELPAQRAARGERVAGFEFSLVFDDGTKRDLLGYGEPLVNERGQPRGAAHVLVDITERKALEASQREALRVVEETLRDNEIFAGVLAHDLRNPLSAIHTVAERHLRRGDSDASAKPLMRVLSSAERMRRMIDQLLDFTRTRVGAGFDLQPADTELAKLCRAAVDEIEAAQPKWLIKLESVGDTNGTWDADRLLQVVSNLVGNAGQHGKAGREIKVTVDGTKHDVVSIAVHNEGFIPESQRANLFVPFRRNSDRPSDDGLGLGIFIANQIVRSHGGTIRVESNEARGTTFTVVLPRRRATAT